MVSFAFLIWPIPYWKLFKMTIIFQIWLQRTLTFFLLCRKNYNTNIVEKILWDAISLEKSKQQNFRIIRVTRGP